MFILGVMIPLSAILKRKRYFDAQVAFYNSALACMQICVQIDLSSRCLISYLSYLIAYRLSGGCCNSSATFPSTPLSPTSFLPPTSSMGTKRSWEGQAVVKMDSTESASSTLSIFENFRDELDEHHDRRERIIKASRDITALSKKM